MDEVVKKGDRNLDIIVCSLHKVPRVVPSILIGVASFEVNYVSNALAAAQMLSSNTTGP